MPLWIVATPLGTLDDLSPRARRILGEAALVACEDTRTTRKLLSAVEIKAPELVSLHAHNESDRIPELLRRAATESVALVADAGTPGISDPGSRLVAAALEAGIEVRSCPGPSALAAALAASGFPSAPSVFLGFPPRKGRDSYAREVLGHGGTIVLFEAGSRVPDLLGALARHQPDREAAVVREISKLHEEVARGRMGDLAARPEYRGECVVVVGPGPALVAELPPPTDQLKDIAAALAVRWGVSRKEAYSELLELEKRRGDDSE